MRSRRRDGIAFTTIALPSRLPSRLALRLLLQAKAIHDRVETLIVLGDQLAEVLLAQEADLCSEIAKHLLELGRLRGLLRRRLQLLENRRRRTGRSRETAPH